MTDQELYRKAEEACRNYHTLYGKYPEKVGIEHSRFRTFGRTSLNFPVMPDLPIDFTTTGALENTPISIVQIPFEAVIGPTIHMDEVYFLLPTWVKMPNKVMAGAFLARMVEQDRVSAGRL